MRAWDLAHRGWKPCDIAVALDVTEGAVSRWLAAARRGGPEALRSHPRTGPRGKLTAEQLRLLPDFLWPGAESYGSRGDVWTCERVAGVLDEAFGVSYSESQVSRLLKRIGWTPQVPITRAIQRDEEAIERWRVEAWPPLRQEARRERRALVLGDEAGSYLLPAAVKTSAPEAETPILDEWPTRDPLSVMGGVTPRGQVYSLVRPSSLNGLHTIEFLVHLGRLGADRLLVIWDGSPIHRRAEVKAFLAEAGAAIRVESLPSYAPDLNPVGWLWRHRKEVEMRNLACQDLDELHWNCIWPSVAHVKEPASSDHSSTGPDWGCESLLFHATLSNWRISNSGHC